MERGAGQQRTKLAMRSKSEGRGVDDSVRFNIPNHTIGTFSYHVLDIILLRYVERNFARSRRGIRRAS
jgi:hypothetical protein